MNKFILVVDDETEIRNLLSMMLRLVGYETGEATDGVDALNKVGEKLPDALILDVMMPNMNGIEVCKALRAEAKTAEIPIIMLSGKAQEEDIRAGLAAGANHYLAKPMVMDDLLNRLKNLLASRNGKVNY
jgi:two-component system phosphate regulon response regulator PhoB